MQQGQGTRIEPAPCEAASAAGQGRQHVRRAAEAQAAATHGAIMCGAMCARRTSSGVPGIIRLLRAASACMAAAAASSSNSAGV